jgi:hypothetical protein
MAQLREVALLSVAPIILAAGRVLPPPHPERVLPHLVLALLVVLLLLAIRADAEPLTSVLSSISYSMI